LFVAAASHGGSNNKPLNVTGTGIIMKRVTWSRTVHSWTIALGVSWAIGGGAIFESPIVPLAQAAEPTGAASIEEAARVIDLRQVELPTGSTFSEGAQLNMVSYETKSSLKDAFRFQQQRLVKSGFKEQPGSQTEATYCNGMFRKDGFTVSLMAYGDPTNAQASTRIFLSHLGNILADEVPVVKDAKRVSSGAGHALYGTHLKAAETVKQTRNLLIAAGWEPYGSNPVPPDSEVQTFKRGAIRLIAYITPAVPGTNQAGAVTINYSLQLMSADIPAPQDAKEVGFSDSTKSLRFETDAEFDSIARFYQERLARQGFMPTTDEIVASKNNFGQTVALQAFRNKAGDVLSLELQRQGDKTTADVTHFTATEVAAREKTQREAAQRLVAQRQADNEEAQRATTKSTKTAKPKTPDVGIPGIAIPDVDATVNTALAEALKGTGIEITLGQNPTTSTRPQAKSKPQVKLDVTKKLPAQLKGVAESTSKAKDTSQPVLTKKPLASIEPQQNAGQIVYDGEPTQLTHAVAFEMTRNGDRITRVILSGKPVKQAALIEYIQNGNGNEHFECSSPHVVLELDEGDRPSSMRLQVASKSLGVSRSDLVGEAVVTSDRARGSFRMQKDGEFFKSRYRAEISFDVPLLTKASKPEALLANATKLETSGQLLVADQTIKLASVFAYETKVSGDKRTTILFTEKPINLAKLKASLQKNGTDDGLFEFQSQVKVEIDKNDRAVMYHLWSDSASLNSNSNLVDEVVVEGGRARGTVKLAKPAEFFRKEYSFELTFDVDVLPLASE